MADKNDYGKDRELLEKALIEGINAKFDEIVENSEFDGECSEEFHTNVKETIGIEEKKPKNKLDVKKLRKLSLPKLIAIIVSAILLTGCALAFVYRDEIMEIIEYKFGDHTKINDGQTRMPEIINDVYTLTYIPEGFELDTETKMQDMIHYVWKSLDGNYIKFTQTALNTQTYINIESGYSCVISTNINVYHKVDDQLNVYVWFNSHYNFKLSSSIDLSHNELMKIISGMTLNE